MQKLLFTSVEARNELKISARTWAYMRLKFRAVMKPLVSVAGTDYWFNGHLPGIEALARTLKPRKRRKNV